MRIARIFASLVDGVRRPLLRRRVGRLVVEHVDGVPLVVLPEVFNPVVFRTGSFLARALRDEGPERRFDRRGRTGRTALDLGTGSGIGAVFAARLGYRVTAVDVNPQAVRCARINATLNRLEDRIEVLEGDLFAPVDKRRFDLVLFNPPFFRGAPRHALDAAWRSADVLERFAAGLPAALAASGRALVVLSSHGDGAAMLAALAAQGLEVGVAASRDFGNEVLRLYSVAARGEAASRAASEEAAETAAARPEGGGLLAGPTASPPSAEAAPRGLAPAVSR